MRSIPFMGEDYLLDTQTAKEMYHQYAEKMPILDYHCHISPQEIWEDKRYENITQLWLGVGGSYFGDHYKWRFMRSCGVEEAYITGTMPDEERFVKWAQCLESAIGNPLYVWSHLELQAYFGIYEPLKVTNAREIYKKCNEKLKAANMSVRGLIAQSGVTLICTTDDPVDSLIWHQKIAADPTFTTLVLPAWRPDKARDIAKPAFAEYVSALSKAASMPIHTFADLKEALINRMDFFASVGCKVSDHGLDYPVYEICEDNTAEEIFSKRLSGASLTKLEIDQYTTAFMCFVAKEYAKRNWVMQIHYGAKRNNNTRRFAQMGADTGYDCINDMAFSAPLTNFLDALEQKQCLPKTILYSLNPNDNAALDSIINLFQDSTVKSKLQHGSAWWFNDHIQGMTAQMISLSSLGNLSTFVGMLTDSRSFLSYTRHAYFRRILCRLLGQWVEEGSYPCDEEVLRKIVEDICYRNAVSYFDFPLSLS